MPEAVKDAPHAARPAAVRSFASRSSAPSGRLTYKDQRELAALPARIDAAQAEIAAAEAALADPGLFERDRGPSIA